MATPSLMERLWLSLTACTSSSLPSPATRQRFAASRCRQVDDPTLSVLPSPHDDVLYDSARVALLFACGGLARVWSYHFCTAHVYHDERLRNAVLKRTRPGGQGLITVMNHTSEYDDPGHTMACLPYATLLTTGALRWTVAAEDSVFYNAASELFFGLLKCVPVTRGGGVYQDNIRRLTEKLDQGDWVNVFPEGRISMQPGTPLLPVRRGALGRMVLEAQHVPMVLPVYGEGLNKLKPPDRFPRVGKDIHVYTLVGEPIDVADIVAAYHANPAMSDEDAWEAIAVRVEARFREMRAQMAELRGGDSDEARHDRAAAAAAPAAAPAAASAAAPSPSP